VERIIKSTFEKSIEVNKIVVPTSKKDKKSLRYARVFFYVSNLKEAFAIVKRQSVANVVNGIQEKNDKN
jgi:hypothetical protein